MYEEYESLHTQWYDTSCGEAHPGGQTQTRPAAAAPPPTQLPPRRSAGDSAPGEDAGRGRHGPLRAIAVCLLAVVLIAATSLAFSGGSQAVVWPQTGDSGQWSFEDYSDYREFFDSYYENTSTSSGSGSSIPRATVEESFALQPQPTPESEELTLQEIYKKCAPSVVGITAMVSDTSFFWGTGIVISEDGFIATNAHIIEGAYSASVTLWDDREFEALLVGIDSVSDLAVLKIEADGLTAAEFCSDQVSVGDAVAAIGNPLGAELRGTLTNGIISAISRDIPYNNHSMTLLQTNAAINEGNSGGPLINMYGQVIGITNMKALSTGVEGIGFAIPTASIRPIVNALLADGRVSGRVSIGITVGAVSSAASEYYDLPEGLYISAVAEGSDAEKQGIQSGDMLLAVNGQAVTTTYDVSAVKDGLKVGDTVTLTIYRDGKTFDVDVKLVDTNDIS